MKKWRTYLANLIAERRLNMKNLSLSAGLHETQVRDWLKRDKEPTLAAFAKLASELGVSVGELYAGEPSDLAVRRIPIAGYVSGGEGWSPVDDGEVGEIELRLDGEPIVLRVRGDSMGKVYRPGDVLIGEKRYKDTLNEVVGRDCIVLTDTGDRYVKIVTKGQMKGVFTLRSYDPMAEPIENVRIAWAAPIVWVHRNG
jgi:phage repressor protein C with HTH and peptisase S24 domain